MASLADLNSPPINAAAANYRIESLVKIVTSTAETFASLQTAINDWMVLQQQTIDTYFGAPVYLGSTGSGANLRYSVLIPYSFFLPPPSI